MEEIKRSRKALILFPQSKLGKIILYLILGAKVLMYVVRAFTLPDKTLTADPSLLSLIGMLIDIISVVSVDLIIMWIARWILVKTKILEVQNTDKTEFSRLFAAIVGIILISSIAIPIFVSGGFPLKKTSSPTSNVDNLSSEEKARFREIMTAVIQSNENLTAEIHSEFWILLRKMGVREEGQIAQLKDVMTGASGKYQRYVWEDAQKSLREGRVFKSPEREAYEKYLQSIGMTEDRRIQNDEFIKKIANKIAIPIQGENVVMNEEMIKEILSNLASATARIDKLFTP